MSIQIGIIMGSDSDLPVMSEAAKVLDELQLEYELTVVSAHRTPKRLYSYAESAVGRGIKVIIAGAGGAAFSASGGLRCRHRCSHTILHCML